MSDRAQRIGMELAASAEAQAMTAPAGVQPHEFVGREDRWCEVCNRPDRNPIHKVDR